MPRSKSLVPLLGLLATLAVLPAISPSFAQSDAHLRTLIDAAGLQPWTFSSVPAPFEFPDGSNQLRSLDRDYRGQVVLLYMFAEG